MGAWGTDGGRIPFFFSLFLSLFFSFFAVVSIHKERRGTSKDDVVTSAILLSPPAYGIGLGIVCVDF